MKKISLGTAFRAFISTVIFTLIYMTVNTSLIGNFYGEPLWIYALSAVIFYGAEFAFSKIFRTKRIFFSLTPLYCTAISLVGILTFPDLFKEFIFFCFLRAGLSVFDFIFTKKYKLIPVSVVACALLFFSYDYSDAFRSQFIKHIVGTPDRTSSWAAINQQIERSAHWKEIVTDTEFTLGQVSETPNEFSEYECDLGSYPAIDGSTVCVPMAMEFARQHLDMDDYCAANMAAFSTTHYAYENLIQSNDAYYMETIWAPHKGKNLLINTRSADIIIATEPSDEELRLAESYGVTLVKKPVCYDAFVFITHKDNPVKSLTVQQIRDIYSGKIKNWKQVGGKDEKIVAYQREKNSGSQTAMENLVMGGSDMIDPIEVKVIEGMGGLVDAVAEYENATASIGYTYRYYIDTLYKNDNIKTIAIDGIAPDNENIRSRTYPFTTNYYGVIRGGEEEATGGKFLDWILSEEGQKCVAQAGYITLE